MHNVTLVGTIHSENGQCNADELYKILENLNPEVIFDELPSREANMFYSDFFDVHYANSLLLNRTFPVVPLEVKCIKKYSQNNDIQIVPVDIDRKQKTSKYLNEIAFMMQTFLECDEYRKLDEENDTVIANEGFYYLNSEKFLDFLSKKEAMEKSIMESAIQKDRLLNIYKSLYKEQCDVREQIMLQNLYSYSASNKYDQAIFLIGAEHRKSIMQKIADYERMTENKLNWRMFA